MCVALSTSVLLIVHIPIVGVLSNAHASVPLDVCHLPRVQPCLPSPLCSLLLKVMHCWLGRCVRVCVCRGGGGVGGGGWGGGGGGGHNGIAQRRLGGRGHTRGATVLYVALEHTAQSRLCTDPLSPGRILQRRRCLVTLQNKSSAGSH